MSKHVAALVCSAALMVLPVVGDSLPASAASARAAIASGGVVSWGWNTAGQLGNGTMANRSTPGPVTGLGSGVTAIATGFFHSLALKSNGSVVGWGADGFGEVGDNGIFDVLTPVPVIGLSTGVIAIAAGANDSVALKSDGSVWGWGYNGYGSVGNGTTTGQFGAPVPTLLTSNVVGIAAGWFHNFALKNDGTAWAWGSNLYGELGTGSTAFDSNTPAQVTSLGSNVVAMAGGALFSLALKSDGSVWSWGYNYYGQLGDGTTTSRSLPGPVSGLGSGVVAISAGWGNALALKGDGTVWMWGDNGGGLAGITGSVPVAVNGLTNVKAIAAGGSFSLALNTDGSVVAWGTNFYGQLGDSACTKLVQPSGLGSGVIAIAAGAFSGLALVASIPAVGRAKVCSAGPHPPNGRTTVNQSSGGSPPHR